MFALKDRKKSEGITHYNVVDKFGDVIAEVSIDSGEVIVSCEHSIEWSDSDSDSKCELCGAIADWHIEREIVDEGWDDSGYTAREADVRVIDRWEEAIELPSDSELYKLLKERKEI